MIRDCKLFAEKLNIKFKFNSYFPIQSLNLMRGVLIAGKESKTSLYIDRFFDACWKDGLNLNDQKIVDKILEDLNFNLETFKLKISEQKIKDELNWTPEETFETGIRKTVKWYLENLDWCEKVQDGVYQGLRLGVIKQ